MTHMKRRRETGLKSQLRKEWLNVRDQISEEVKREASKQIASRLLRSVWYDWAECVLVYLAIGSEVDTRPMIEQMWREGKKVLAPKVDRNRRRIEFYEIHRWEDLVPGTWGIAEPVGHTRFSEAGTGNRALLLVPGVAFDRRGYRIGYGGGYYDRFLMKPRKRTISVGLTYESQMVPEIPAEPHDLPVDGVLTENGWEKVPPMPEGFLK